MNKQLLHNSAKQNALFHPVHVQHLLPNSSQRPRVIFRPTFLVALLSCLLFLPLNAIPYKLVDHTVCVIDMHLNEYIP